MCQLKNRMWKAPEAAQVKKSKITVQNLIWSTIRRLWGSHVTRHWRPPWRLYKKTGNDLDVVGFFTIRSIKPQKIKLTWGIVVLMVWPWYRLEIVFAQLPTAKLNCLWRLNGHHTDDDGGGNDDTDDATAATWLNAGFIWSIHYKAKGRRRS